MDIKKLIDKLPEKELKNLKKTKMAEYIDPMLATLTKNYFSSDNFMYEHKWDGERIIAYKDKDQVRLMTRNNKLANEDYPEIVKDIKDQKIDRFIIDGEVIAEKNNQSNFSILQKKMHSGKNSPDVNAKIFYYIFDIMYLEDYDLRNLELIDRKFLLKNSIEFKDKLKFTDYFISDGLKRFKEACKSKWEGLIVKDIHSKYEGVRSKSWLKFKCIEQQEFVVGGYTEPKKSRVGFGAILVGYYENSKLIYAGKVGTGFDRKTLEDLKSKFIKIKIKDCPFYNEKDIKEEKFVNFIKPELVAEIKFSQWTAYNKLRQARFMGLRNDKNPKDVVKEIPKNIINKYA